MPDFNPTVLRRMLALRQFPLFAGAALDELANMAENLVSAHFPAGTVIAPASSRLPALQLVVDGRIEMRPHGLVFGPRHVFGALEVASGRPVSSSVVAVTETDTLQLSASDFGEVLEDNFGVLRSALQELATRLLKGPVASSHGRPALTFGAAPLGMVQRLILFRQQLPFATARLHALAALASRSDEVTWPGGTTIVTAGDPATDAYVIVDGAARVTGNGNVVQMLGPGDPVGYLETLAGALHTFSVETVTPVRALRSTQTAILDVLEDHTDVGLAMIQTFSAALLDTLTN